MKKNIKHLILLFVLLTPSFAFADCNAVLTRDSADFLADVIKYVRIGIPILLIALSAGDYVGAVSNQDKDSLAKANKKIVKRFIAAAAIFFTPLIINVIYDIPAVKNSLNLVDDPFCEGATLLTEEEYQDEYERTRVTLNRTQIRVEKEKDFQLKVISSNINVEWSSNNRDVATVDQNGKVTAVGVGTAKILAKSKVGTRSASCTVSVYELKPKDECGKIATGGATVGNAVTYSQFNQVFDKMNSNLTAEKIISLLESKFNMSKDTAKIIIGTTAGEGYSGVGDPYFDYAWANVMIKNFGSKSANEIYEIMHPSSGGCGWEGRTSSGGCGNYYERSTVEGRVNLASQDTLKTVFIATCFPDSTINEVDGLCTNTKTCSTKADVCTC